MQPVALFTQRCVSILPKYAPDEKKKKKEKKTVNMKLRVEKGMHLSGTALLGLID